jgi:hypothetical protein
MDARFTTGSSASRRIASCETVAAGRAMGAPSVARLYDFARGANRV